jgi:hypothetical protein
MRGRWMGVVAIIMGTAGPALAADNPFGTTDELKPCVNDAGFDRVTNWSAEAAKSEKVSPACVAEVDRRAKICLQDPEEKKTIDDPKYSAHKDPLGYCESIVFHRMQAQLSTYAKEQKKAKEEADEKAKIAGQKVPKADMHDAKLEKLIADAYKKNFPDNKILKVIITDKKWDFERDALNRITGRDINASVVNKHPDGACEIHSEMWVQQGNGKSYHGPFDERGAGSLEKVGILCENVK